MKKDISLLDKIDLYFRDVDLSDCLLIACQHILKTNFGMFQHLFRSGLKPRNTFLIGKCYSTNKKVMDEFRKAGVYVDEGSIEFDSYESFDRQFEGKVKKFIEKVKKQKDISEFRKIIILDDGGYLIHEANRIIKSSNAVSIEQTSSGYTKLKKEKINFPIINVARSKAKLVYESPFIAEKSLENIKRELEKLRMNPKRVLIVGGGAIGKEIFKLMKRDFFVSVYDSDKKLTGIENKRFEDELKKADMIIGATGKEIIGPNTYSKLKKDVILVSVSSSDREFCAVNLRRTIPRTGNCHKNIYVQNIHLLNCGFPINFDGGENSVSPEKIQLTRALILASVYLAKVKKYKRGVVPFDRGVQEKIINEFKRLNYATNPELPLQH